MTFLCGIDGCRGGWVAAIRSFETGEVSLRRVDRLADLLCSGPSPDVAAVDIPIGLTDAGPRHCDVAARRLLGHPRGSSVFPAPIRAVLPATSYEEACLWGQTADGRKISQQTYNTLPKIREMDDLLRSKDDSRSDLRSRVHEVHPEVSFSLVAGGRPMQYSKRKQQGIRQRRALLEPRFGSCLAAALSERKILGCTEDDIVDAFVALWTAERIARGEAQTIPRQSPKDRYGLTMAIVA